MTPQERQWLESVVRDPRKLRRQASRLRLLTGVLTACMVVCAGIILGCGLEAKWAWLVIVLFAAQIAGNLFNLRETSRLLKAAGELEKEPLD